MVSEEQRRRREELRKVWKEEAMNQGFVSCDKRNEINGRREDKEPKPETVGDGCRHIKGKNLIQNTIKAKKY